MEENTKKPVENGVVDSQVTEDVKMENQVPMHRFNEVIQERNELRSKMAEISSAEEEARAKSLEEQGKFETLLTEERQKGKTMAEKYTQLEDTFNSYVNGEKERLLADLPETKRERYQDVDLKTLRNLVEDLNNDKVNMKKSEAGTGRTQLPENPFKSMDTSEKRKNWNDILQSYKK